MKTNTIEEMVEECIGIMGKKEYRGSYSAPREAFSKLLKLAKEQGSREVIEKLMATHPDCIAGVVVGMNKKLTQE